MLGKSPFSKCQVFTFCLCGILPDFCVRFTLAVTAKNAVLGCDIMYSADI
jgi:hypothetical protein